MAIQWVKEQAQDTVFQDSLETGKAAKRRFLVKFDSHAWDNTYAACNASGIPSIGSAFSSLTSAGSTGECYLIDKQATLLGVDGQDTLYQVSCNYNFTKYTVDTESVAPWIAEPIVDFSTNPYEQVLMNNTSGSLSANFACNTAGDPFDPAPTFVRSNLVADVRFSTKATNVTSSLIETIVNLDQSTNNAAFELSMLTIGTGKGKVSGFKLNKGTWTAPLFGYQYDYYDVTFQIEISKKGWDLQVLNAGFNEIKNGRKSRISVMNPETGQMEPCVTPQLLTADGLSMTSGIPTYSTFKVYDSEDWSPLSTFINDRD